MAKKANDRGFIGRITESSHTLSESFNLPQIELNGNKDAIIEGCKGVLEYDCSTVKLNCGCICVRFCGTALTIRNLAFDRLVVSGEIMNIDFST